MVRKGRVVGGLRVSPGDGITNTLSGVVSGARRAISGRARSIRAVARRLFRSLRPSDSTAGQLAHENVLADFVHGRSAISAALCSARFAAPRSTDWALGDEDERLHHSPIAWFVVERDEDGPP